jgi:hypothetical protein
MIYRETFWKMGDVTVVEVIPLSGQNIPVDYSRFRFRMAYQHILSSGPVVVSCDVPIRVDNVVDAMEYAVKIKPEKERELSLKLSMEVGKVMEKEVNNTSVRSLDIPKVEEDSRPSEK